MDHGSSDDEISTPTDRGSGRMFELSSMKNKVKTRISLEGKRGTASLVE